MSTVLIKTNSKHLLAAVLVYLFWIMCFAYFSYSNKKADLYANIDQQLTSTALATSSILPPNLHKLDMKAADVSKSESLTMVNNLSAYAHKTNIIYIYSVIRKNGKIFFTASSATEEEINTGEGVTYYFDEYDTVDPSVHAVFDTQKTQFIEYTDQWGTFRSVYIPQYAEDGRLYLVAADIPISDIQALLNKDLYQTILISVLFLAFIYPFYLAMTRRINLESKRLAKQVRIQNKEIIDQSERLSLALKSAQQGWFDINLNTQVITIETGYIETSDIDSEAGDYYQLSVREWHESIHPDDKQAVIDIYNKAINSTESAEVEYRQRKADGSYIWLNATGQVVEKDTPIPSKHFIGINTNITERKQSEIVLRAFAESVSSTHNNIFEAIVTELASAHNVTTALIAKLDERNPLIVNTLAFWHGDKIVDNTSYLIDGTPCEHAISEQVCFYPSNIQSLFPKDHLLVEMNAQCYMGSAIKNSHGEHIGLIAMLDDKPMHSNPIKTQRLLKSLAMRIGLEFEHISDNAKIRLSSQVFEYANESIVITDTNGNIIDVNPAYTTITGYSKEDVIGNNYFNSQSKRFHENIAHNQQQKLEELGHWQGEVRSTKKNGELFTKFVTMSALKDAQDNITHFVALFSDITPLKDQQKALEHLAHYDQLTALPNRRLFADRYQQAVAHCSRHNNKMAICFLDLDNFKQINDNYGHDFGDELLINVANRLTNALRGEDTACRFGGDEFAILMLNIDSTEHCEASVQRIYEFLTQPYTISNQIFNITASFGLTIYPDDNADLDTLIRHADQAMYQAKLAGRNQVKLFNPYEASSIHKTSALFQAIEYGIEHDQFELYYQPKVNVKTGKAFGVEALIRWQHPEKGMLFPDSFLPEINGSELESKLGNWVIDQAIKQQQQWQNSDVALEVSVNISSNHIQATDFIDVLETTFKKYPTVSPESLQLEILESSALGDHVLVSQIINTCEERLGIKVALDDFGTGYSSLTHLRNLPVETIKIDRSFVRDLLEDPNDFTIIEGIISLGKAFHRNLIAEGVETIEHGLMLLTMGCDQFQGYQIAKPMPAGQITAWLNSYILPAAWSSYINSPITKPQNRITQYQLISDSWLNLVNTGSQTQQPKIGSSHRYLLNPTNCHHTLWLERAHIDGLITDADFSHIDALHQQLHKLVNELVIENNNALKKQKMKTITSINKELQAATEQYCNAKTVQK